MNKKLKVLFKISLNNKESYLFHLFEDEDKKDEKALSEVIYELAIEEANRFIDFYFIDEQNFIHRMEHFRRINPSLREKLPKFALSQIEQLKKGEIQAGPFILEFVKFL